MNSIMAFDEASEESVFLSALNASLSHFVHKTLKNEQVECIRRIVCHGERCFGRVTDGIRRERHLSVDSKVLLIWAVQPTPYQKPPLLG